MATINDALDLPIHHYIELDFQGFRDLVGAIGGVPVFFPEPVRDRHSGLNVPEAGCVTLDPVQALAYARSRAYEVQRDGESYVSNATINGRFALRACIVNFRTTHADAERLLASIRRVAARMA